jgi:hypothetical protein
MRHMAGIYLSETTDPALRALPKYAIGDRMRIIRVDVGNVEQWPEDSQHAFQVVIDKVLPIEDIVLWETEDPENPYQVTYEFEISHLTESDYDGETLYLNEDEIEPCGEAISEAEPADAS